MHTYQVTLRSPNGHIRERLIARAENQDRAIKIMREHFVNKYKLTKPFLDADVLCFIEGDILCGPRNVLGPEEVILGYYPIG